MKRDMDLVRDILLHIDAAEGEVDSDDLRNALDCSASALTYHLDMLVEQADFLNGQAFGGIGDNAEDGWVDLKITWAGHEFLDQIRDPEIWRQTKQAAQKAGGFSLEVLGALAKGLLAQQIAKHTGFVLDL